MNEHPFDQLNNNSESIGITNKGSARNPRNLNATLILMLYDIKIFSFHKTSALLLNRKLNYRNKSRQNRKKESKLKHKITAKRI